MDELVRRWAHGWRLCRGLAAPTDRGTALEVTLGLPDRDREVFTLTDHAETVDDLAIKVAKATTPTWLTVTTNQPTTAAAVLEQAGLKLLGEPCLLMSTELAKHPEAAAPPPRSADGDDRRRLPLQQARLVHRGNDADRGQWNWPAT